MISASLSLSLPRLGWKSTSTPRSLKICTAAGESASEMRTLGLDIGAILHTLPWRGMVGAQRRGGVKLSMRTLRASGAEKSPHPDAPFGCVDPPPPGEGDELSRLRQRGPGFDERPIDPLRQQCEVGSFHGGAAPD